MTTIPDGHATLSIVITSELKRALQHAAIDASVGVSQLTERLLRQALRLDPDAIPPNHFLGAPIEPIKHVEQYDCTMALLEAGPEPAGAAIDAMLLRRGAGFK